VISRVLLAVGLAALMLVSGVGSYMYLGSRQTNLAAPPQVPTSASPSPGAFKLPGTLYVTQSGAIYSLSSGRFHQLTPTDGWTMLAQYSGGNLLAVKRYELYSDVFVVSPFGTVVRKLTNNAGPPANFDPSTKHWSFYPRLSYNKRVLFMSYDKPKFGYDVPMSIWAVPIGKTISQGRLWSNAIDYTGGDMQPLPLRSGALIYTKYLYFNQKIVSQIWITNQPETPFSCGGFCISVPPGPGHGTPLTKPEEDCSQPSLSPDGRTMAMICSHETQVSYLAIASFNGHAFGPRHDLITRQLVAQPTWAPDGSGIAYLAPAVVGSGFQLWWLPRAAYARPIPSPVPTVAPGVSSPSPTPTPASPSVPVRPVQMTANVSLDATSPIAWIP
jgi:WD40 repeat protein